jgi:hypothetical protein
MSEILIEIGKYMRPRDIGLDFLKAVIAGHWVQDQGA